MKFRPIFLIACLYAPLIGGMPALAQDTTPPTITVSPMSNSGWLANSWTAVAAGQSHTLALKNDRTVWAWGYNVNGQLGNGTVANSLMPVQVPNLTGVTAIAAGWNHSLALRSDGTVWAWGLNSTGELGDGTTTNRLVPVQVQNLTGVITISAGSSHSLAVKNDGTVWAWGYNADGELGDGTTTQRTSPVQVYGLAGIIALSAGQYHSLAVDSNGNVWAWGKNSSGQLGNGSTTVSYVPFKVPNLSKGVTAIAASDTFSLAVENDGNVWAWGNNSNGQLGNNTTTSSLNPVQVKTQSGSPLNQIAQVATISGFSLARDTSGNVWAWGVNNYFQLANGTITDSHFAIQVYGLANVFSVSAGTGFAAVLESDGSLWTWGYNNAGQVGDGTAITRTFPGTYVAENRERKAISAREAHGLMTTPDGTVWAWGNNNYGQLGDGTTTERHTPVQVSGLTGVIAVSGGSTHSLALKSDGTVWAWGYNLYGQLGDGTTAIYRYTPVQVSGLTGVIAVSGGGYHSLALKSDGTVWAWGHNGVGQLGDGTATNRNTPVQVSGLTGVIAVSGGSMHSLALKSDGTVWAWGYNFYGQLGDGTTANYRYTPVQVTGLTSVISVSAGDMHSLALKSDGTVWASGYNAFGLLGDGTTTQRNSAVQVTGLTGVISVSAGTHQSLALKSDGTVWAWGYNYYGQLGDGTTTTRYTPVEVSGLTGVTAMSSGWSHSLALSSDGTVSAWGDNEWGQLGDGTMIERWTPILSGLNTLPLLTGPGRSYSISAEDMGSGLSTPNFQYRLRFLDDTLASSSWGAWQSASPYFVLQNYGRYWLQVKSTDLEGNTAYWPAGTDETTKPDQTNPSTDPPFTTGDVAGPSISFASPSGLFLPAFTSAEVLTISARDLSGLNASSWSVTLLDVAQSPYAPVSQTGGVWSSALSSDGTTQTISISREGKYALVVYVADTKGNVSFSTSAPFFIDNTAPAITLGNFPAVSNTSVTVSATVTDPSAANGAPPSGIATSGFSYTFTPTSGQVVQVNGNGSTISISVPPLSSPGTYQITFTATDTAGNQTTKSATVVIDNSTPVIAITTPIYVSASGSASATATTSGGSGIDVTTWAWRINTLQGAALQSGIGSTASWSGLGDGQYALTFTVKNTARTQGTGTKQITIDTTAPVVTISGQPSAIVAGETSGLVSGVSGETLSVSVMDNTDPSPTTSCTLGGSSVSLTSGSFIVTGNGDRTFIVTATDGAGNASAKSVVVHLDNVSPAVIAGTPVQTPSINGSLGYVTFSATVSDDRDTLSVTNVNASTWSYTLQKDSGSGYQDVAGQTNISLARPSDSSASFAGTASFVATQTGNLRAIFSVRDFVGNIGTASVAYTAIFSGPSITFTPPAAPVQGIVYVSSAISVVNLFSIQANPNPVASLSYMVDGVIYSPATAPTLTQGNYAVSATAIDNLGNTSASPQYTVVIDQTPPSPSWATDGVVNADSSLNPVYTQGASVLDFGITLSGADSPSNTTLVLPASPDPATGVRATGKAVGNEYDVTVTPPSSFSGPFTYALSVAIKDLAGNISPALTKTIYFDGMPPAVTTIHVYQNGAELGATDSYFGGTLSVNAEVADSSPYQWRYLINATGAAPTDWSAAQWLAPSTTAATVNPPAGATTLYLYVQAKDAAGNAGTAQERVVQVDNNMPGRITILSTTYPYATSVNDAVAQPSGNFQFTAKVTSPSGLKDFQWRLFHGSAQPDANFDTPLQEGTTLYGVSLTGLSDNQAAEFYWLAARAVGGNGQSGDWSYYPFAVDTTPPKNLKVGSSTNPMSGVWYKGTQIVFQWNKPLDYNGVKNYYYALDYLAPGATWTPRQTLDRSTWTQTLQTSLIVPTGSSNAGEIGITLYAEDYSGNSSYASFVAFYDNESPVMSATLPATGNGLSIAKDLSAREAALSWQGVSDTDSYSFYDFTNGLVLGVVLDAVSSSGALTAVADWRYFNQALGSTTFSGLVEGQNYLAIVVVQDPAGNILRTPVPFTFGAGSTPAAFTMPFQESWNGLTIQGTTTYAGAEITGQTAEMVLTGTPLGLSSGSATVSFTEVFPNNPWSQTPYSANNPNVALNWNLNGLSGSATGIALSKALGLSLDNLTLTLPFAFVGIDPSVPQTLTFSSVQVGPAPSFYWVSSTSASFAHPMSWRTLEVDTPSGSSETGWSLTAVQGLSLQNAGWQTAGTSQVAPPSSGFTVSTTLTGGSSFLTLASGAYGVGQSLQSGSITEQGYYIYAQGECLQAFGSVIHGDRISIPDAYVVSSALSSTTALEIQDVSVDLQGRMWSGPSFKAILSGAITTSYGTLTVANGAIAIQDNRLTIVQATLTRSDGSQETLNNLALGTGGVDISGSTVSGTFTKVYSGFTVSASGGTIQNGIRIFSEATVNLASYGTTVIVHNLGVSLADDSLQVAGVATQAVSLSTSYASSAGGAGVLAANVTLNPTGLTGELVVTLPASWGGGVLYAGKRTLLADGTIGNPASESYGLLSYQGFIFTPARLRFTTQGLVLDGLSSSLSSLFQPANAVFSGLTIASDGTVVAPGVSTAAVSANYGTWSFHFANLRVGASGLEGEPSIALPASLGGAAQTLGTTVLAADGTFTMQSASAALSVSAFGWTCSASSLSLSGSTINLGGVTVAMPGVLQSSDIAIGALSVSQTGELLNTGNGGLFSFTGTNGFRVQGTNVRFAPQGLVMGGQVMLPSSLGGAAINMPDGAITLAPDGAVLATASGQSASVSFAGWNLQVPYVQIDHSGLTITGAVITPLGLTAITLPSFTVYGSGELAVAGESLSSGSFILPGTSVQVSYSNIRFADDGVHLSASISLPSVWGGQSLDFDDVTLTPTGQIRASASLQDVSLQLDSLGMAAHFDSLRLSFDGFQIDGAEFSFVSGPMQGRGLSIDSVSLDFAGKLSLYGFSFGTFNLWGYQISLNGLEIDPDGVGLSGTIQLPQSLPVPELAGLVLALNSFKVGFDGTVKSFDVAIDQGFSLTLFDSWTVSVQRMEINQNLLSVTQATLQLPAGFLVSSVGVSGMSLNVETGELDWGTITIAGVTYSWNGLNFQLTKLTIDASNGLLFQGQVQIPEKAPNGAVYPSILQNTTLVVDEFQIKPDGTPGVVSAALTGINGPLFDNAVLLSNATFGFDDSSGDLVFRFTGQVKLGSTFPPGLAGVQLTINALSFNASDGSIRDFSVSATSATGLTSLTLFGAMTFSPSLIGLTKTGAQAFQVQVQGDFLTGSSFPGVLANQRVAVHDFRMDSQGTILTLDASLALPGQTPLLGGISLDSANLAVSYQTTPTQSLTYTVSGKVDLGSGFPGGLSGLSLDINKMQWAGDGAILALDVGTSWTGDRTFFGAADVRDGSISLGTSGATAWTIGVAGTLVLPSTLPQGLAGLAVKIGTLSFDTNGNINQADLSIQGLNIQLFGAVSLINGSLEFSKYDASALRVDVGGSLSLPSAMGAGLAGLTVNVKEFSFTTAGAVLAINGSIGLPTSIPIFAGITATGTQFQFSQDGLACSGSIQIPAALLTNLPSGIVIQHLLIGWNGKLKDVAAGISAWTVQLAGFSTDIKNLVLSSSGITIESAVMTLPPNLGSRQISITNAGFETSGRFTGTIGINEIDQTIAGFNLQLFNLSVDISSHVVRVAVAQITTPPVGTLQGTIQLNSVTIAPDGVSLGGIGFSLPDFDYGGVGFRAVFVSFSVSGSSFDIAGKGQAQVAGLGNLDAELSFTNISSTYPVGLKRAYFSFYMYPGIPLGTTGLYLNRVAGGFAYGPPDELAPDLKPLFDSRGPRLQLGVGLYAGDPRLVEGTVDFWIDLKNAAWAFDGRVTVLSGLATGRLAAGYGNSIFYGTFEVRLLFVDGKVSIWIFPYHGSTVMSGEGSVTFIIPQGFFVHISFRIFGHRIRIDVPDSDWRFGGIYAEFGQFDSGKGVKGWVDIPILGDVGAFVDNRGIHFNIGDYDLIKPAGY